MPHPDFIRNILIALSLVSFLGMFVRPFWGVVSYMMIMMLRPGLYIPFLGALRIEFSVGIAVLLFIFISGRIIKIKERKSLPVKWLFILFGVMSLSMVQAMDVDTSWLRLNEFIKVLFFFVMIVTLTDDQKDCEILLFLFGMATAMFAYEAIYNYMTGNIVESLDTSQRLNYATTEQGMGSGHVALANLCNQALAVVWYIGVCHEKLIMKLSGIVLFGFLLTGVIVSGSRGGFIGIGALAVCLIVFSPNKVKMGVSLIIACFTLAILNPGYFSFMKHIQVIGSGDVSTNSRIMGLQHGFEMLLRRPLLGVGPGCYPIARRAWFGWGLWSHNLYGELMGDLGIAGVIAYYKFLSSYLKEAFQMKMENMGKLKTTNFYNAIIVATIVRLVMGMGSHSLYIFFWYMMAGLIIVASNGQKNTEYQSEHFRS